MKKNKNYIFYILVFIFLYTLIAYPCFASNEGDLSEQEHKLTGEITLPASVTMNEGTYFDVWVHIDNIDNSYSEYNCFFIKSNAEASYEFSIPQEYHNGRWVISYCYGSCKKLRFPENAVSPLRNFKSSGSASSGTVVGGGGEWEGLTHEKPEELEDFYDLYVREGKDTIYEADAGHYTFEDNILNVPIDIVPRNDIAVKNEIGGYYANLINSGDVSAEVSLLDASTQEIKYKMNTHLESGKYLFSDIADGSYILGLNTGKKQLYYREHYLVESIDEADVFDVSTTPMNYSIDMFYENIFPVNIPLNIDMCLINDVDKSIFQIQIFDIFGNIHDVFGADEDITVKFSPFILGIDGIYVKRANTEGINISEVTTDFDEAFIFTAEYRNALTKSSRNGTTHINIQYENWDKTDTVYSIKDNTLDFSVVVDEEIESADIWLALYDENECLIATKKADYIREASGEPVKFVNLPNACSLKVMTWSTGDTMFPFGRDEKIYVK